MLKMAFCAFKIFRDNIWKMTPCWPPPKDMEFSICFVVIFFESFPKAASSTSDYLDSVLYCIGFRMILNWICVKRVFFLCFLLVSDLQFFLRERLCLSGFITVITSSLVWCNEIVTFRLSVCLYYTVTR